MAQKVETSQIALSAGVRRTRDADPFLSQPGELTEAQFGTYTAEGGFKQFGGIDVMTSSALADGGYPVWMYRWFRGPSFSTNPFLVLSSAGTLYLATAAPDVTGFTFTVAQDWSSGSGVNITGINGKYFSVDSQSDWLFLKTENASDKFYAFDGTKFYQVGAVAPTAGSFNPTVAGSGTGGTFAGGNYQLLFTFYYGTNRELGESNGGVPKTATVPAGTTGSILISNIPASAPRGDVGFIRVYRTLVGGSVNGPYYYVGEVTVGTTVLLLTAGDADLAFANFEMETDHSLPPSGVRSCVLHLDRMWLLASSPKNRIIWSLIGQPYVYPALNSSDELIRQAKEITLLFRLGDSLFASSDTIWTLAGNEEASFYWANLQNTQGFVSPMSVRRCDGVILGLGYIDLLAFDGSQTVPLSNLRGYFERIPLALMKVAVAVYRKRHYYLAVQTSSSLAYDRILLVNRDPTPGAENGFAGSLLETRYGALPQSTFQVSSIAAWKDESDRVFVGLKDGKVYEFDRFYNIAKASESPAGPEFKLKTPWFFPSGPNGFQTFEKWYVAIEDEGGGGEAEISWEIMDDNLASLREGYVQLSLSPQEMEGLVVGRYNVTRYA